MSKWTKRQKYIKEKYFKVSFHNPFQFSPILDERIKLSPMSLERVIDIIINILEQEHNSEIVWEKIT